MAEKPSSCDKLSLIVKFVLKEATGEVDHVSTSSWCESPGNKRMEKKRRVSKILGV